MEQWLLWTTLPSLRAAINHKAIDTWIDVHPKKTLIERGIRLPPGGGYNPLQAIACHPLSACDQSIESLPRLPTG